MKERLAPVPVNSDGAYTVETVLRKGNILDKIARAEWRFPGATAPTWITVRLPSRSGASPEIGMEIGPSDPGWRGRPATRWVPLEKTQFSGPSCTGRVRVD